MAKEKTEFEIFANTLKAMNKYCTAKVKDNRAALSAIFISNEQQLAFATDGHKIAILDMYGHMEHKEIEELAFYADMQAIEFNNGFALVSAKKKETFVKNFGEGIADPKKKLFDEFDYPNALGVLPKAEGLQHCSNTHAVFLPSNINAIDKVVTAADKNDESSVSTKLYGKRNNGIHIAFYGRLIVAIMPVLVPKQNLEEMPTDSEYFNSIRFAPTKDPEEPESGLEVIEKHVEEPEDSE